MEKFNPSNPEYRKVEDLPKEEQGKTIDRLNENVVSLSDALESALNKNQLNRQNYQNNELERKNASLRESEAKGESYNFNSEYFKQFVQRLIEKLENSSKSISETLPLINFPNSGRDQGSEDLADSFIVGLNKNPEFSKYSNFFKIEKSQQGSSQNQSRALVVQLVNIIRPVEKE